MKRRMFSTPPAQMLLSDHRQRLPSSTETLECNRRLKQKAMRKPWNLAEKLERFFSVTLSGSILGGFWYLVQAILLHADPSAGSSAYTGAVLCSVACGISVVGLFCAAKSR